MRKYQKILKNINLICIADKTNFIPTEQLKYPIYSNNKNRAAYAYLKAKELIKFVVRSNEIIGVERLQNCIVYFEDKHLKNIDTLKNWSMNILIAIISSVVGAVLARISMVLFP